MIDHDKHVGEMLDLLDELKIADNTFVMYSTDNGPHMNSWPDAGQTPFRNEKNSNWEGAFPRARDDSVSRQDHSRLGVERNRISTWTGCRPFSPRPAEPNINEKLQQGPQGRQ